MCIGINQTHEQLRSLEANFNLRHYSVFPNACNAVGNDEKDQCGKAETSAMMGNSLGLLHEPKENTRIAMPVKRGREAPT